MHLAPNNTVITATITKVFKDDRLEIVILETPDASILPAFLSVGKLVTATNQSTSDVGVVLKEGDIITAEIEVMGDPFKQTYLVKGITNIEEKER